MIGMQGVGVQRKMSNLDHVVDERHAKVPVEGDGLVLEHVFETALGTVLGKDDHAGGGVDAGADEAHRILVGHVAHLFDLPQQFLVDVDFFARHLFHSNPRSLRITKTSPI